MAAFLNAAITEARQTWSRRTYWLIQVLLLIPISLSSFGPPIPAALVLLYLAIPYLVGAPLLEEARRPSGPLARRVGVLAGLWLGLLPGSLVQIAGWFLASCLIPSASQSISNTYTFWIWPASLAFLLLANTVGLFLVFLLAVLVRRARPSPLWFIWTLLWLLVVAQVIVLPVFMEASTPMQQDAFYNIFFQDLRFSPTLGLGLSQERVTGMGAWFLGLGLLAAVLGLALSLLTDRRRAVPRWLALTALVMTGALAAAGGYALNSQAASTYAVPVSPYDPQIDAWIVNSHQAEVSVNASTGALSGASRLSLSRAGKPAEPELVLRLNPGLELVYAREASGADLPARRLGDSVVLSLPLENEGRVQLDLAWEGRLQISSLELELRWKFSDGPGTVPYLYAPAPLKALVISQGGFLLRDGDWRPWPWSSAPHQAVQNRLTLRPTGGEAAASIPIQDGAVTWEGPLPQGLLAFLPEKRSSVGGSTVAVAPLAGSQHTARASLIAEAAGKIAARLGEQPPRYVVVAPYLSELVWSGDLLLIPDGSGSYLSNQLVWLYRNDVDGPERARLERTAAYLAARAWMRSRYALQRLPFQPRLWPPGDGQVISTAGIRKEAWYEAGGHWVQFPEVLDTHTTWTPRKNSSLTVPGEQSTLAFWLALELADEKTRQDDLDLLAYFESVNQRLQGYGERYARMYNLYWPEVLKAAQARVLVQDLHAWAEQVGPEEAVSLAAEVIREFPEWNQKRLLEELEARSGVEI